MAAADVHSGRALSFVSRINRPVARRIPLVPASVHPKRSPRAWIVPAIIAVILFIGAVASNLVAAYVQSSLDPYRRWVWASFGIALTVAIAVAIREARRTTDSPASSGTTAGSKVDGDVVARDKITHIYQPASPAAATALHQLPPPASDFTGRTDEL